MTTSENKPANNPQPLDKLLGELAITNHELVASSTEQLTHKNVANARKGRPLTINIQMKILNALNARTQKEYRLRDLFNYPGRRKSKTKGEDHEPAAS
jgi:hypothetical protein